MICAQWLFSTNASAVAFIRASYGRAFRFRDPHEHSELLETPTKEAAEAYLRTRSIRKGDGTTYSALEDIPAIKDCGIGLYLYFFSLKYFAVVFLICQVIGIGSLVLNYEGGYYDTQHSSDSVYYGYLGNVLGYGNQTVVNQTSISQAMDIYKKQQFIKVLEVTFDASYTLIYLISVVIYAVWTRRIIEIHRSERPTLADYSLKLTQLPERRIVEVAEMLEKTGINIAEIVPVRHINQLIYQVKHLKQCYKLAFLQALIEKKKRCSFYDMAAATKKEDRYRELLDRSEQVEKGHSAIMVFSRRKDRYRLLKAFRKGWFCGLLFKLKTLYKKMSGQPRDDWLQEVNVKKVATPDDIFWENIRKLRWRSRLFCYFAAILIVLLSAGAVFGLKKGPKQFPTPEYCSVHVNDDYCDCILDSKNCDHYEAAFQKSYSLKVTTGVVIIIMNLILPFVLEKLTSGEKQSSMPRRKLSAMMKIFFAMLINTSFVILFVHANFQSYQVDYTSTLKYPDFTRGWYIDVGFTIMASMCFGILAPHIPMCLYYAIKKRFLQPCVLKYFDTQLAYNNWVVGTDIDLPLKTAIELVAIFGCFLYAGGMPLMLIMASLSLFAMYMGEKYMLKYYETPSERSTILHTWFVYMLPWAAVLHCMCSLYMFGAGNVFPKQSPEEWYQGVDLSALKNCKDSTATFSLQCYFDSIENTYWDRVSDYCGITFLLLITLGILIAFACPSLQSYLIKQMKLHKDPLSKVIHSCAGGKSYQIYANENYRPMLERLFGVERPGLEAEPPQSRSVEVEMEVSDRAIGQMRPSVVPEEVALNSNVHSQESR